MSAIVFNNPKPEQAPEITSASALESEVANLQTTLASLNQVVYSLRETLQERDQEIADLKKRLTESDGLVLASRTASAVVEKQPRVDDTVSIIGALINLYKFAFPNIT